MDNLPALEQLITEFYNQNITNQRRQIIENDLLAFENNVNSWKECLQYIRNSNNVLVCSFCFKVIENIILKRWSKLVTEDKQLLRISLTDYLISHHGVIPSVIVRHVLKLLTKIAGKEWPDVGSTFIEDITRMIQSDDTKIVVFGLWSLQIASEELVNCQDNFCTERKLEIKRKFENYIPEIFLLLNGILQKFKGTELEIGLCESVLNVYLQLFSWLPLSDMYTSDLLLPIYEYTIHNNSKIRILSLSVLNEILYKNCVPSKNTPLIIEISCNLNRILILILESNLKVADEEYIVKILEMTSLIFSLHWHRIELNMGIDKILSFVSCFYKLTFHPNNLQSYCACLEIWRSFFEYLIMRDTAHVKEYENLLLAFMQDIINKFQSQSSESEKLNRSEEEIEDPQSFFNLHMSVIDLLTELMPENIFTMLLNIWNSAKASYSQLLLLEEPPATPLNEQEIIALLNAFEITTQILASLHSKFDNKTNTVMLKNLLDITYFANSKYLNTQNNLKIFLDDLTRVHCELLKAVPFWVCFSIEKDEKMIAEIFCSTLPLVVEREMPIQSTLRITAAHLIARLIHCLKQTDLVQPLLIDPSFTYLPIEARRSLQSAVCCYVCCCKNEPFENRLKFVRNLFDLIVNKKLPMIKEMTEVVKNCKLIQAEARELFCEAIKPWFEFAIDEFTIKFPDHPESSDEMITFVIEVCQVIKAHISPYLIEKILRKFDDRLFECIDSIHRIDYSGVEKMMYVFTLIIEGTDTNSKEYVSRIISIMQKVFQLIIGKQDTVLLITFYKLLFCILGNRWQYFYKKNHLNEKLDLENREEFEAILNFILESFQQSDIDIFRNNLCSLEEINDKWILYDRDVFQVKYLPLFLNALLNTLIEGTHKLLTDEISTVVYHMSSIDFKVYFEKFIPLFISQLNGLTEEQKSNLKLNLNSETDMPSFIQTLFVMVNDIRSYRIENGSM